MHGGEEEKLVKMQTRYVERTGNVGREKRGLDSTSSSDEGEPDRKKPALARVIVEALKVESLQKLCSSLEPILRRIVSEELERALAKLGPAKLSITGRPSPKHIEGPDGRKLQLHFKSKLSLPLFTGGKVEGEQSSAIHFVLIDASTCRIVTSGPESSVKLDVIVLEGDFNNEDDDNWTQEEFDSHIVREREGKRPLLSGELQLTLKDGIGMLGEVTFTDNSSWIRSRKFRLGLKVAPGCCEGIRIREAKTDAFTVKDHRGELYKKHYPPALTDEVWRLEKIGKDGSFHKRLSKAGIHTVKDFLQLVARDSQRLRNILGSGMSNKMWDVLVEHAKTCVQSGKLYVYYPEDAKHVGVVFNNLYELSGLIANGEFHSAESLSENQKVFADGLVTQAYENWMHVTEYDSKSLLEKQNQSVPACQADFQSGQQQEDIPNAYVPNLSATAPPQQPVSESNPTIGGYEDDVAAARFSLQSQTGNLMAPYHLDATSLPPQNLLINALHQSPFPRNENLPLAPSQLPAADFHSTGTSNINSFTTAEDLFSEEMLENEDMQSFLRMFNMGGQGLNPFNVADGFPCSSPYMPTPPPDPQNFIDDQSRSSGKAVVGWLKLKAALRWGLFVRKKAAERRAQLVELDDM